MYSCYFSFICLNDSNYLILPIFFLFGVACIFFFSFCSGRSGYGVYSVSASAGCVSSGPRQQHSSSRVCQCACACVCPSIPPSRQVMV